MRKVLEAAEELERECDDLESTRDEPVRGRRKRPVKTETKLWVDKYRPAHYGELLSDEV